MVALQPRMALGCSAWGVAARALTRGWLHRGFPPHQGSPQILAWTGLGVAECHFLHGLSSAGGSEEALVAEAMPQGISPSAAG